MNADKDRGNFAIPIYLTVGSGQPHLIGFATGKPGQDWADADTAEVLEAAASKFRRIGTVPCPTCQNGRVRETVGMVCQTCGHDYAATPLERAARADAIDLNRALNVLSAALDVEELARVLYAAGAFCGDCEFAGWDTCADCRAVALAYSHAVVAHLLGDAP